MATKRLFNFKIPLDMDERLKRVHTKGYQTKTSYILVAIAEKLERDGLAA